MESIICNLKGTLAQAVGCLVAVAVAVALGVSPGSSRGDSVAAAQETDEAPLFEKAPFDRITLTQHAGGGTYKVRPIEFSDRRLPVDMAPHERLKVHLLAQDVTAEIAWRDIAEIELFEQIVLEQAEALSAQRKFERAYAYYQFLHENYPDLPRLDESTHAFLYVNAGVLFQQGDLAKALALLEELHRRNPNYDGLPAALARVIDRVLQQLVDEEKFAAARKLLDRSAARGRSGNSTAAKWRARLIEAASAHIDSARAKLAAEEFRNARRSAQQAVAIWPSIEGGAELMARLHELYPMVIVAAPQLRPTAAVVPALHPTALRRDELTRVRLVRLHGYSSRGPEHGSGWGDVELSTDRRNVEFHVDKAVPEPSRLTGYDMARFIAAATAGDTNTRAASAARIIRSVDVDRVYTMRVELTGGYVSPVSLLAELSPDRSHWPAEYAVEEGADEIRFLARNVAASAGDGRPREIVERVSGDPHADVDALRRGRVDAICRVLPAQVPALQSSGNFEVRPYAVPSVHVLVPNMARPFPASRTFRRAVAYATDREQILRQEILAGAKLPGCQTISGPFPRSEDVDHFWGYACDEKIAPLPFEPRLAVTLWRVAQDEIARADERTGRANSPPEGITIGHEDIWLHRTAVQAIVDQLNRLGIAARRLELGSEDDLARCDFCYAELLMREPIVDAEKLLGRSDLARSGGYLALALRDLSAVTNWRDARDQLHRIHAAVHAEHTVIPLWQLTDYFAVRQGIAGVSQQPITLYQDIQQWRVALRP